MDESLAGHTPYRVAVVTTSRADYGIWRPVMSALRRDERFDAGWVVTGSHLLALHGRTIERIKQDDSPIWHVFECLDEREAQDATQTALAMARALGETAKWMSSLLPDVVMVLGDRFEMFAVASATVPFRVPVVHVHGGEVTLGAMDESFRHAMTKLSHLHMTSTQSYAQRVRQLGEASWRVHAVGAPALDGILASMGSEAATHTAHLDLPNDFVLVTYHPETHREDGDLPMVEAMLHAIASSGVHVIFTAPNADPKGDQVRQRLESFVVEMGDRARLVESFGVPTYYHVMRQARAMIGNSSSGILEAASFGLPVVNLGGRQQGRIRGKNVYDVAADDASAISKAITWALDPQTHLGLAEMTNPYGDGHAATRIVNAMAESLTHPDLLRKTFEDIK